MYLLKKNVAFGAFLGKVFFRRKKC